jgi:MFS family permease
MNFAMGIPVLFLAIWAGSLADRVDRRKLILATQAVLLVQASVLGWLYVSGRLSGSPVVALAWVVLLSLVNGIMSALAFPAWQSVLPDLVPKETLLNAIALNSAQFQSARLVGPLLAAALVVAGFGMGELFFVNAASFLFVILALWLVHPRPHDKQPHAGDEHAWQRLTAGLRYATENRVVGVLILSTAILTIFAMPYMMLLPAVVKYTLGFPDAKGVGGDPKVISYVMAANGLGAMVGSLVIASLPRTVRRENLMRFAMLAMALLLLAFAYSRWLPLTLVISALAGAAFITSTSLINTSIQSTVPNQLRGRVMALFVMSFIGIMPLSAAAFGPLGQAIGPSNAIGIGASVLLVWVAVLLVRPGLLGLDGPA